jgi:hypothetical protein
MPPQRIRVIKTALAPPCPGGDPRWGGIADFYRFLVHRPENYFKNRKNGHVFIKILKNGLYRFYYPLVILPP